MGFPTMWGVRGLNEADQRAVRGGVAPKLSRAQCIRDLLAGYAADRRIQPASNRPALLLNLRAAIASCASEL